MRGVRVIPLAGLWVCAISHTLSGQTITPSADGTIVDGGSRGPFDGVGDWADWTFNQSGSEGAITLSASLEQRVVWEFNLTSVTAQAPVTSVLSFVLRGAAIFPAVPADVLIAAYPADLVENLNDFSAGPAAIVAEKLIPAYASPTRFVVDVSEMVNTALTAGIRRVAFRFEIDPETENGQAFFDAVDTDPASKPSLIVQNRVPGDLDGDRDVDLEDLEFLIGCMLGPGRVVSATCRVCDSDMDLDVDLADLERFSARFSVHSRP